MRAPAAGGKERKPVKAPRKKMKLRFPVTLNLKHANQDSTLSVPDPHRSAVQLIPLANWKAMEKPMMMTPM